MKLNRLPTTVTRRPAPLVLALLAIAATFASLSILLVRDHRADDEQRTHDANILSAARAGITSMISIRDTTADDDVQKVLDQSTGEFKSDFKARSGPFINVVREAKVVTQGQVTAEGIENRDGESAIVLVSATSTVSNAAGATNETRGWRLRVTMSPDDGQYKISNVEFVA